MVQLTLTVDSPCPANETRLTVAIADMIHSLGLSFSLTDELLFQRVITLAKSVPTSYKTPTRQAVGGSLLQLNYNTRLEKSYASLQTNAEVYGLCLYGDGATVKKMPLINILASGAHLTTAVLEIADCTGHLAEGGTKDAR